MVSGRLIAAETKREITRASGLWTLAGALAFAGLLALFALAEAGTDAYALATYIFFPLLVCPLAAQRVAADREHGVTAVTATTPVDRASFLLAKLTALSILLLVGLALTLPLLYALTETTAPGAFRAALPLVGWGVLVGFVSLVVGLAIGYAKTGPSTGALSVGFGLVIAWFIVAVQRHRFVAWADGELELAVIQAVLHANPMTWALEAEHPAAVGVVANHVDIATGLVLLVPLLALGLGAIALGLQHWDGWLEHPARHPLAVVLLAVSVLGTGALLATWDYARPAPPTDLPSEASRGQAGDLHIRLEADQEGAWRSSTPLVLQLTIAGPPNATVTLEQLALTGSEMTVRHDLATPTEISLDEIRDGHGRYAPENQTYGTGELTVRANATPHRIAKLLPLTAHVTLDGKETTLATDLSAFDWQTPTTPLLLAGGIPLAVLAPSARIAKRRWNRW